MCEMVELISILNFVCIVAVFLLLVRSINVINQIVVASA